MSREPFIFFAVLGGGIGFVLAMAGWGLWAAASAVRALRERRQRAAGRALTAAWTGKVLREPATGQVSLCVAAALRAETWWERWVRAEPVLLLTHDGGTAASFRCQCMMCVMARLMFTHSGLGDGRIRVVPARLCAIAPATDAAAFLASLPKNEEA